MKSGQTRGRERATPQSGPRGSAAQRSPRASESIQKGVWPRFRTSSDSPQRAHDLQTHGAQTRQKTAGQTNSQGSDHSRNKDGWRQNQLRQHAVESVRHNGDSHKSKQQSHKPAKKRNQERLGQHEKENRAIGEADSFENGELAGSFAHGNSHGVSSDQEKREKHNRADAEDQKPDVAELLDPTGGEGRLGFGFGFVRRIGKFRVDTFGDA